MINNTKSLSLIRLGSLYFYQFIKIIISQKLSAKLIEWAKNRAQAEIDPFERKLKKNEIKRMERCFWKEDNGSY